MMSEEKSKNSKMFGVYKGHALSWEDICEHVKDCRDWNTLKQSQKIPYVSISDIGRCARVENFFFLEKCTIDIVRIILDFNGTTKRLDLELDLFYGIVKDKSRNSLIGSKVEITDVDDGEIVFEI